jgi:hypothetical protein
MCSQGPLLVLLCSLSCASGQQIVFAEAETAILKSQTAVEKIMSDQTRRGRKANIGTRIESSEKSIADAALALESELRANKLAELTLDRVKATSQGHQKSTEHAVNRMQKKIDSDFEHLQALRKSVLEAHPSTASFAEETVEAQTKGMDLTMQHTTAQVRKAKATYDVLHDRMLEAQSAAAKAMQDTKEALKRGAPKAEIEALQKKEAVSMERSEKAMAAEEGAKQKHVAEEEAAKKQEALIKAIRSKGDQLRQLITQVKQAESATAEQRTQIEALKTKKALDVQYKADEEEKNAVRAALKYAEIPT